MAWHSSSSSAHPAPTPPPRPASDYPSAAHDVRSPTLDGRIYGSPMAPHNFQSMTYPQILPQHPPGPPPSYTWQGDEPYRPTGPQPLIQPAYNIPGSYPQPSPAAASPRLAIDTTSTQAACSASPTPGFLDTALMASTPLNQVLRVSSSSTVSTSTSSSATAPPSTAPFPTVDLLRIDLPNLEYKADADQLAWAQDVVRLLDRLVEKAGATGLTPTDASGASPPPRIPSALKELSDRAVPIIISHTSHPAQHIAAQACYLRGNLLATGICEDYLPRDARQAFKDFETAAKGGEARGWYRLGRDYETVGDPNRARECFQRGQAKGDCESTYRMAMACFLGQLGIQPDPHTAVPLLRTAYQKASIDCPQPAYVYGMLLACGLDVPVHVPPELVLPASHAESAALVRQFAQAREALERAGYLCLSQAQYKCGWMYEHAAYGCAYDPLLSVQWYSLASQGGEVEADMALSKWFLCGADGHFAKNEKLARTFAEKAARKGHLNASFAMGYYYELGIGGGQDTERARKWYDKASRLGNREAADRLRALAQPNPMHLSVQEHESRLNDTLVRRRTDAAKRSDQRGDRQARRRRDHAERDRERTLIEADRVARAQRTEFGVISPNPEMHSPRLGLSPGPPKAGSGHTVIYPVRPTTAYQPFMVRPQSPGRLSPVKLPSTNPEEKRYSLSDATGDRLPSPGGAEGAGRQGQSAAKKGPQTFAEMGFQSKPVEDEGCTIM